MLVLRTLNFQGATIRSIVSRHKHSIVFIVHHQIFPQRHASKLKTTRIYLSKFPTAKEGSGVSYFPLYPLQMILHLQLFRERLSHKRGKAYATMSKVIMGNGGFYGCLSEPQSVSAWWKETAQTHVFVVRTSALLPSHLKPQSNKPNVYYIILIGIVACAFTLLWDNLC